MVERGWRRGGGANAIIGRLVFGSMVLALACSGPGGPVRRVAHAVVEGDDASAPVQIVTSTVFNVSSTPSDPSQPSSGSSVALIVADTVVQTLPFDRTFDIHTTGRFFIRVQTPPTATDTPSVNATLKVFVDGEQRSNVAGDLATSPLQAVFLSSN